MHTDVIIAKWRFAMLLKALGGLFVAIGLLYAGFLTGYNFADARVSQECTEWIAQSQRSEPLTYGELQPGTYIAIGVVKKAWVSVALVRRVSIGPKPSPVPVPILVRDIPDEVIEGHFFRIDSLPYPGH